MAREPEHEVLMQVDRQYSRMYGIGMAIQLRYQTRHASSQTLSVFLPRKWMSELGQECQKA